VAAALPLDLPPVCPKCGGPTWDNTRTKTNPSAPDYRCRDKACGGAIWPNSSPSASAMTIEGTATATPSPMDALESSYLDTLRFVLDRVVPEYATRNIPFADSAIAATTATIFLSLHRQDKRR